MTKRDSAEQYITVQELESDIAQATGNPTLAKTQAHLYAIMYRGNVIDAVKYKRGLISKEDLTLSRHIRWEHTSCHSQRLHKNMINADRKRPANTAAHHIVSWNDIRAGKARLRLAAFGIDIDHEANGVFLPRFHCHTPCPAMPNAVAHSKTHTKQYYLNVEFLLDQTIAEGFGRNEIIETLREIGEDLQDGTFPLYTEISEH